MTPDTNALREAALIALIAEFTGDITGLKPPKEAELFPAPMRAALNKFVRGIEVLYSVEDVRKGGKLLVAYSEDDATATMKSLDLSRDEWRGIGMGCCVAGCQFDKIVVVINARWRDSEKSLTWKENAEKFVAQLRCRLRTPQSEFIIL